MGSVSEVVDHYFAKAGFIPEDRSFKPHITIMKLSRVKNLRKLGRSSVR